MSKPKEFFGTPTTKLGLLVDILTFNISRMLRIETELQQVSTKARTVLDRVKDAFEDTPYSWDLLNQAAGRGASQYARTIDAWEITTPEHRAVELLAEAMVRGGIVVTTHNDSESTDRYPFNTEIIPLHTDKALSLPEGFKSLGKIERHGDLLKVPSLVIEVLEGIGLSTDTIEAIEQYPRMVNAPRHKKRQPVHETSFYYDLVSISPGAFRYLAMINEDKRNRLAAFIGRIANGRSTHDFEHYHFHDWDELWDPEFGWQRVLYEKEYLEYAESYKVELRLGLEVLNIFLRDLKRIPQTKTPQRNKV